MREHRSERPRVLEPALAYRILGGVAGWNFTVIVALTPAVGYFGGILKYFQGLSVSTLKGRVPDVRPDRSRTRSLGGHCLTPGCRERTASWPGPRLPGIVAGRTVLLVNDSRKQLAWKGVSAAAAALSVIVTRRVLGLVWERFGGEEPPTDPGNRRLTWRAALTWAVAMSVGAAVSRVVAVRLSARVWEAATHEAPPELA